MKFDYSRSRATAERLIARFGQEVVLIKPGVMAGPEWDRTEGLSTEHVITVVDENSMRRDLTGTLIGEAVHALIVSTSAGIEPEQADRVRIGGRVLEITEVRPLAPGGAVLLWEVSVNG